MPQVQSAGLPDDLIKALGEYEPMAKSPLTREPIDQSGFGKSFQSKEPERGVPPFSLTKKQVRKLLDLAKEDFPTQVYRLAIWLTFLRRGLTAKQLSVLTKIPLSSVNRAMKGSGVFYSIGRPT
jgi:hypothetical protein